MPGKLTFKFAGLLALPLLLAACAPEVESEIYLQDIEKVAQTGEALTVPALIRIPQSDQDSCEKGLPTLIANLATLAPTTGKGECIQKSNNTSTDTLAEIETELVIAPAGGAYGPANLLLLEVKSEDKTTYGLSFRLLKPIDEIVAALTAGSDAPSTDFDPTRFIFRLSNDGTGQIGFAPNHVFVDGEPGLPESGTQTLARRKDVEIRFSDVASTFVEKANSYRFVTVTAAQ
jgi:hypothetical protein